MKQRDLEYLNNFSVLYIEDENILREQTTTILEDFVKAVYPCSSVKEAREILQEKTIDIIVSDILLKDIAGTTLLAELRQNDINIPAILVTAHTDTEYLLEAIKLKVEHYLIKPINIKELLNSIYDVLLPRIQDAQALKSRYIIRTVAAVTDGKAVEMIKFIINNLDENGFFNYSYGDIMDNIKVSKPTVIKLFKQLLDYEILTKIQNSKYKFNEEKVISLEF